MKIYILLKNKSKVVKEFLREPNWTNVFYKIEDLQEMICYPLKIKKELKINNFQSINSVVSKKSTNVGMDYCLMQRIWV